MPSGEGTRETLRVARAWRTLVRAGADLVAIAAAGRVVHDTPRSLVVVAETAAGPRRAAPIFGWSAALFIDLAIEASRDAAGA